MNNQPITYTGLSSQEARMKLRNHGYNELPTKNPHTLFYIAFNIVKEPMFLLLIGAGSVYLVLGDTTEALMLLGFVIITIAITVFQERKAEKVLETLRDLSSPRALVIRDGVQTRIAGRDVVVDDLLILEEGDRIAADAVLIESHDLLVDESLLTGESMPVTKNLHNKNEPPSSKNNSLYVYSGSLIVQGGGLARVIAIGASTEIGKIGKALREIEPAPSPLQHELKKLVKQFSLIGILLSLLVFVLHGITKGDWLNGLLSGITLAMSILPEEFTVVLTVFMALGAWQLSKSQVLTRHMPVIETLGSATVLCVDKTGTLTENRMSLACLMVNDDDVYQFDSTHSKQPLSSSQQELLQYAVLASEIRPFDPMDKAFHRCAQTKLNDLVQLQRDWQLVHEYPLSPDLLAMTHVWRTNDDRYLIASKGAPEAIAKLCKLAPEKIDSINTQVESLASRGMRVLGVAKAEHSGAALPETPINYHFSWLGLAALADPIRSTVPYAIEESKNAGIRVVMITGDYPATAKAIADQIGLPSHHLLTGKQINTTSDAELQHTVREVQVFARVLPEQKLRLVNAFKANGEIVAMTGDGVNDAPALKAAHIGISMGEKGTDVAREASSLVLLNDDFTSIVKAVRIGRTIYDNLRKALLYVVAVHMPIAGMVLLPLLFGLPMTFAPVHIVFLEMIINPAIAIVFQAEPAEADIMRRPPRKVDERIFNFRRVGLVLLQGLGLFFIVALIFIYSLAQGTAVSEARALAFICLVCGNLALIVTSRSSSPLLKSLSISNRMQWWIIAGTIVALSIIFAIPLLRRLFLFSSISIINLNLLVVSTLISIAWLEFSKSLMFGRIQKPPNLQ